MLVSFTSFSWAAFETHSKRSSSTTSYPYQDALSIEYCVKMSLLRLTKAYSLFQYLFWYVIIRPPPH